MDSNLGFSQLIFRLLGAASDPRERVVQANARQGRFLRVTGNDGISSAERADSSESSSSSSTPAARSMPRSKSASGAVPAPGGASPGCRPCGPACRSTSGQCHFSALDSDIRQRCGAGPPPCLPGGPPGKSIGESIGHVSLPAAPPTAPTEQVGGEADAAKVMMMGTDGRSSDNDSMRTSDQANAGIDGDNGSRVVVEDALRLAGERKRSRDPVSAARFVSATGWRRRTAREMVNLAQRFLPSSMASLHREARDSVFCTRYSLDGDLLMTASQDRCIRLYSTATGRVRRVIPARDVGWSVVDVDYSPDGRWLAYSSWCPYVHVANLYTDDHEPLNMEPDDQRVAFFSVRFSPGSGELLAGCSDAAVYLYDLPTRTRTVRVPEAHRDDVNTVCYLDASGQTFASGADDGLVHLWDARTLGHSDGRGRPTGTLVGHSAGLTHIDTRGDGFTLATNSKDQAVKLWDTRMCGAPHCARPASAVFDYRWQRPGGRPKPRGDGVDHSLLTMHGHKVARTLIRCRFSPLGTTGGRYLATGSFCGDVFVYDCLTGKIVRRMSGHTDAVRDVAWSPSGLELASASWDCSAAVWTAHGKDGWDAENADADVRRYMQGNRGSSGGGTGDESDEESDEDDEDDDDDTTSTSSSS